MLKFGNFFLICSKSCLQFTTVFIIRNITHYLLLDINWRFLFLDNIVLLLKRWLQKKKNKTKFILVANRFYSCPRRFQRYLFIFIAKHGFYIIVYLRVLRSNWNRYPVRVEYKHGFFCIGWRNYLLFLLHTTVQTWSG